MTRGTDISHLVDLYRSQTPCPYPQWLESKPFWEKFALKYGENPHQGAKIYGQQGVEGLTLVPMKEGKGGFSGTNYIDAFGGLQTLKYFKRPTVVVKKHDKSAGFATTYDRHTDRTLARLFALARDVDSRSSFGMVMITNVPIDLETAQEMRGGLVDVVVAPDFEEGVMDTWKKNVRVLKYSGIEYLPRFVGEAKQGTYDIRQLDATHVLVQEPFLTKIRSADDLIWDGMLKGTTVATDPTPMEREDLLTAWYVTLGVPANAILLLCDGVSVGLGAGQMDRVGCAELAITKAYQNALGLKRRKENPDAPWPQGMSWDEMDDELGYNPIDGCVLASDAFCPFRDTADTAGKRGVTAIIQPGGSERDLESIQAVNEHNMAMGYTGERIFKH